MILSDLKMPTLEKPEALDSTADNVGACVSVTAERIKMGQRFDLTDPLPPRRYDTDDGSMCTTHGRSIRTLPEVF